MFLLDGTPLALDVPFTHPETGVQYPANWLRLASPEERAAIGITEAPDPEPYDQRFAWGFAKDGSLIWKDHSALVAQWAEQTRITAGTLLTPTDWMVIRESDNGTPVPDDIKLRRQEIRELSGNKVTLIEATTTSEELANYVCSPEYSQWEPTPATPSNPEPA